MFRFFDAANAVTLTGLAASLACALLAANARPAAAIVALIVAGLCDFLDGAVARKLSRDELAKTFGAKLDTVVDGCAFGIAPAVLLYAAGMRSPAELLVLFAFAAAAVWRLAYFETLGMAGTEEKKAYTGLPTTYVALVLPFTLLAGFAGETALRVAADLSAASLAVAMVAPVENKKLGGPWYGIFLLLAAVLVAVYTGFSDSFPAPPL